MGIDGLLKNLKKCMQEKNLEEYRGQKAAVDTYAWLHKIIKGPSGRQIIAGKDPTKFVNDCIRRAQKISKVGIDLTLVFDGGPLPRKLKQQQTRKRRRDQNLQYGKQLMAKGNYEQGIKKMIDSIDISPDVAFKLYQQLKKKGFKCIIAPYQADAQLAYLSRAGLVDIIITEDSDLLAFGARKILYKLDFGTLNGEQICLENIKTQPETGFCWFTHNMFLSACIMAGCDYLNQIKGVGMKLAQRVIAKNHTIKKALAQISQGKHIPQNYQQDFMKAMLTFRFQRVYCPIRKACVQVNEMQTEKWRDLKEITKTNFWYQQVLDMQTVQFALKLAKDENNPDWQFLGRKLSNQMARRIAQGEVNPTTFQSYDDHCLDKLRYQNQGVLVMNKKPSTYSLKQNSNPSILKFCKPLQKKNPLQYKSTKSRSITEEEYKVYSYEQKMSKNCFPVTQIYKIDKKKSLKFNDDSDEQEKYQGQAISSSQQEIQLISSNQSPSINKQNEPRSLDCNMRSKKQNKSDFRNKLQQISQKMFGKIFSDQFLKSPFSY